MGYYAYHLGLREEDIAGATLAFLPGDPERTLTLASFGKSCYQLAYHREFKTVLSCGDWGNVLIVSTGIGGPSLAIAVEELAALGCRQFIRVGTCGAIQKEIVPEDLIISEGAVRMDGTSDHYAPLSYPACAHWDMVKIICQACEQLKYRYWTGITCSSASFYPGQERYNTFSGYVPRNLRGTMEEWQRLGVLNYEMEVATLFTVARALGLKAGAVCGVLVNRQQEEEVKPEMVEKVEQKLAQVVAKVSEIILTGKS